VVAVEFEEDLLGGVLGVFEGAEHAPGDAHDPALVGADQGFERPGVLARHDEMRDLMHH
jgi:hypothetical protein